MAFVFLSFFQDSSGKASSLGSTDVCVDSLINFNHLRDVFTKAVFFAQLSSRLPAKDTSSHFALQINENSLINFVVDLSPLRAAKCN